MRHHAGVGILALCALCVDARAQVELRSHETLDAAVEDASVSALKKKPRSAEEYREVLDDCLNVACGQGYIRPLKVQRAGRAAMTAGELLRGFPISTGTVLP